MKFLLFALTFCYSTIANASGLGWGRLELDRTYYASQSMTLHLDENTYSIKKNTPMKLIEVSTLTMIKVVLHKFKINNCPATDLETDLELVNIPQNDSSKTTVGVNLAKSCILEVFVEAKDVQTLSFVQ